jgi:hypothetical protein
MTTAADYFLLMFPNYDFEFNLAVAYMYPLAISMFLLVRFGAMYVIRFE